MRNDIHPKLSAGRITRGPLGTTDDHGLCGAFEVVFPIRLQLKAKLLIISSGADPDPTVSAALDGIDWEHVSVSVKATRQPPTWQMMCFVKELFWDDHEAVVQYHPPADVYVNQHPSTLHLWKPKGIEIPVPHPSYVGAL